MADDNTPDSVEAAPPTGDVNKNTKQVLANTFQNGPLDSKKWVAMIVGISCAMFAYLCSTGFIAYCEPSKSASFMSLATTVMSFIGGMTATYLTGQSAVEWKTSSVLSDMHNTEVKAAVDTQNINNRTDTHTTEDRNVNIHMTKELQAQIVEEGKDDAPELKPFGLNATNDDDDEGEDNR